MLVLAFPYPKELNLTADTTLYTADNSHVVDGAPSGLRVQFSTINAALRIELARRNR